MRDMEVTLTLSRKQAESIKRACDLLSRVYMGQFREVAEYNPGVGASIESYHGTQEALEHVKREAMPDYPRNAYRGIRHPEVPDEARVLYDVLRVIDHALAWKDNPEGGIFPRFDEPRQISQEPLPRISLEDRTLTPSDGLFLARLESM
jgi:hypothetical protein